VSSDAGVSRNGGGASSPFGCSDGGELKEKEWRKKKEWGVKG
jgi:hypothetical protein